jgi:hypothetical protein
MTSEEATAIACSIRRHFGADAENYVRQNIQYFEDPSPNEPAALAWREVLCALNDLPDPPD